MPNQLLPGKYPSLAPYAMQFFRSKSDHLTEAGEATPKTAGAVHIHEPVCKGDTSLRTDIPLRPRRFRRQQSKNHEAGEEKDFADLHSIVAPFRQR